MALVKAGGRPVESPSSAERARRLDFTELVEQLRSDDPARRRQTARELSALPESASLLCQHLEHETSVSVRSVIITSLIQSRSRTAVEGLIHYLHSEDSGLRNLAIEALQDMPEEVGPYMEALLNDPESDVRIFAVNILSVLPNAAAPQWLNKVILEEEHVNVCAAAVDCLAEVGAPESIAALKTLRLRFIDHPFMSFAIDAAIRRIGGSE
jgi:HEAT repeat protein